MAKKNKNSPIKGFLLVSLFRLVVILPGFIRRFLAVVLGYLSYWFSRRTRFVIETNLGLCFPELAPDKIKKLIQQNFLESASLALEFPVAWMAEQQHILSAIGQVSNKHQLDQLVATEKPVIVAVPHIGNWEFLWQWIQLNYQSFGMYSPAKIPALDKVMFRSRQRFGGEAFATDAKGIISLLRRLKKAGVMMILTDQAPKQGSGNFAPFFGIPAYTMTLLHKFLQKSQANLVFASCLRQNKGNRFEIDFYQPIFDIRNQSAEEFNAAMNRQIEEIILRAPEQYQWSYKRFKRQADGVNYYRKP